MKIRTRWLLAALLLATPALAIGQEPKAIAKKSTRPSLYDAKADAREQVKTSTALARRDAKRVLLMFGGDWCGWCHRLHGLFASDPTISDLISNEYVLTLVDTQAPNAEELLAECRGKLEGVGFPFLTVLDGDGKIVTRQKTDPLEEGDHHDPAKVKAFLTQWAAPKAEASKVFAEGLARASSENKLLFLHFGAPTCGWCHRLDAFLAREDMASLLGKTFVDVKLDLNRMTGADVVLDRYKGAKSGGIPWYAILDAEGKKVVDSDGPNGNIGYPLQPDEIVHFLAMLRKAPTAMSSADLEAVSAALKASAKVIEAERAARVPE